MPPTKKLRYKNLNDFTLLSEIKNHHSNFSHEVSLVEKNKNGTKKSQWYAKSLGANRNEALFETIAQEFSRLIRHQQPKTRRLIAGNVEEGIEYYVLSKEIPGFNDTFFLYRKNYKLILDGSYTGLAATQVLALFLNEVDFKAGNVGVDEYGHVIKIDGGLSFIQLNRRFENLYKGKNLDITTEDLEALPNLVNYEACNWLNQIQWSLKEKSPIKKEPSKLEKRIHQSTPFKHELYLTILKIILLPDQLIHYFTQCYMNNIKDAKVFSKFIIARKQQLAQAASQISDFMLYRQSDEARENIVDYLNYLKTFKTMCSNVLLTNFEEEYRFNIEETMLGKLIEIYSPIKNFSIALNEYAYDKFLTVSQIDFDLLTNNVDIFLDESRKNKIVSDIESLKVIINDYLNSPTISKEKALFNTFTNFKEYLKEDNLFENSFIKNLLASIDKLLPKADNIQRKPIPIPRKNMLQQTTLPNFSFFNRPLQN